jgi:hypothetical protein
MWCISPKARLALAFAALLLVLPGLQQHTVQAAALLSWCLPMARLSRLRELVCASCCVLLDSAFETHASPLLLLQVPGVLPSFPPAPAVPDMSNIAASLGLGVPGIGAAGMAAAGMAALGSMGLPVGGGGGGGGGGAGGEQGQQLLWRQYEQRR